MTFERSYINWSEGVTICCWSSPSKEALEALFKQTGTPFETMIEVEEHVATSLTP